jgi:3-oxoacyl-[acyl-carrier protein] reductase
MFKTLSGKTVVVTGSSRGIGKSIARRFGELGLNVLVVSRNEAEAKDVAVSIGENALGLGADVTTQEGCEAMVRMAVECFGGVDILCANAGAYPSVRLGEMSPEDFDSVINTNLKSLYLSVSAVLPELSKRSMGRIIITSSITGPITGYPGWAHYGAAKAGQLGFMRTAAIELASKHITINAVLPGNIMTEGLAETGEAYLAGMAQTIPLKRLGTPEDVANAVVFFASEEAAYITGQTIVIDGGQILPETPAAVAEI